MIFDAQDEDFTYHIPISGLRVTKLNTLEMVWRVLEDGIPGDLAEVGVGGGGHPAIMAYALRKKGAQKSRRIHLYDSFAGNPQPGEHECRDYQKTHGINPDISRPVATGVNVATIEQVKANMNHWNACSSELVYHVGFFEEVMPREATEGTLPELAYLRMDCNLFSSTLYSFKYLYPKIAHGGYIASDDWGSPWVQDAIRKVLDERGEPFPEVTPLEGQHTTVWWRKP